MTLTNQKARTASPVARKWRHLGLIAPLMLAGVLLYYLGDLPWLEFEVTREGFLTSQAFHEVNLLVITISVIYAAIIFRLMGGILAAIFSSVALVPHTLLFPPYQDSFFREAAFAIITVLLAAFIGTLLNSRDRLESEHQRLELFIAETLEKQELERQHLAHELHDETAQELVDISHRIDELIEEKSFNRPYFTDRLRRVRHDVDNVLEGTRRFIQGIRPPLIEELGLKPALFWLVDQTIDEAGIQITMDIAEPLPRVASAVEMNLFRIAQEALTNARRHSQATEVNLSIKAENNQVIMKIADNGVGFHMPTTEALGRTGKFGIMGITERARLVGGIARVEAVPGAGTAVTVRLPIGEDNHHLPSGDANVSR